MTNPVTMHRDTCMTCYNEQVLHLKASSTICTICLKTGTRENPFPNFKKIEKGDKTNESKS